MSTGSQSGRHAADNDGQSTSYYANAAVSSDFQKGGSATTDWHHNFLNFLCVAQRRQVDLLPITWRSALPTIGIGATADIRQSSVNLNLHLAFKRARLEYHDHDSLQTVFQALTTELFVLGHPTLRNYRYISRLEGICWEFVGSEVWPVMVFKRSTHGNLREFMRSQTGGRLSIHQRLDICSGISMALMTMHAHRVIHGDIKPDNILIFQDAKGDFFAKVADFGYATLALHRSQDQINLPRSPPWNAPEVVRWDTHFTFAEAKLTDIFSFALLCLWTLFKDAAGLSSTLEDLIGQENASEDCSPNWLQYLKESQKLRAFTSRLIGEDLSLDQHQKQSLTAFFDWSLRHEARNRHADVSTLERVQTLSRRWHEDDHVDYEQLLDAFQKSNLDNLDGLYLDLDGPLGFSADDRPIDLMFLEDKSPFDCFDYDLAQSFLQILIGDFRLWPCIYECLGSFALEVSGKNRVKEVAFSLALCSSLGFGTDIHLPSASQWLKRSGRSQSDVENAISSLKTTQAVRLGTLSIPIDNIVYADVYRQAGILEQARTVYATTTRNLELTLGEMSLPVVRLRFIEADLVCSLGSLGVGVASLEKLADRYKRVFGATHVHTLTALAKLAGCYNELGGWEEAERICLMLKGLPAETLGSDSSILKSAMTNLAYTYWKQAKWERAEAILLRIMELRINGFGMTHPSTLIVAINLASVYDYQGKVLEGEKLKVETLRLCSANEGDQHPLTLAVMGNLAGNYRIQRRYDDAMVLERKVVEARQQAYGRQHPTTLKAMGNLASTYAALKKWQEAYDLDKYVMDTSITTLGYENPDTVTAMNNMAHTYYGLDEHEEAIRLMDGVVHLRERLLGPIHPDTVKSKENLIHWQAEGT